MCVCVGANTSMQPVKHRGAALPQRKPFITRQHPTFTQTLIWELVFMRACVFSSGRPHLGAGFVLTESLTPKLYSRLKFRLTVSKVSMV